MFSGIIEKVAQIQSANKTPGEELEIEVPCPWTDITLGESIAVNGVCLTSTQKGQVLKFFVSRETLVRTQLGSLKAGSLVNLERALKVSDRLSGHYVQGHVDCVGQWIEITPEGESRKLVIEIPNAYRPFCVPKGSITVNGVSLTINKIAHPNSQTFELEFQIIPHTWENTEFKTAKPGHAVNIEVDVIAKYVANWVAPHGMTSV